VHELRMGFAWRGVWQWHSPNLSPRIPNVRKMDMNVCGEVSCNSSA